MITKNNILILSLLLCAMVVPVMADVQVQVFSSTSGEILLNETVASLTSYEPLATVSKVMATGVINFDGYGAGESGNFDFLQHLTICADSVGYEEQCTNIDYDPVLYGLSTFDIFDLGTHYVTMILTEDEVVEPVTGIINIIVKDYDTTASIAGATIYYDNVYTTQTNNNGFVQIIQQTPGYHQFTITKTGYQMQTISILVTAGEITTTTVILIPLGSTVTPTITGTPIVMETRSYNGESQYQTVTGRLLLSLFDYAPWIFIGSVMLLLVFSFMFISPRALRGIGKLTRGVKKAGKSVTRGRSSIVRGYYRGRR